MACAAVLCDSFLVTGGMAVIVTAETSGIVRMSKVVWIRSPRHFQIRKHIAAVDCEQDLSGCLDIRAALGVNIPIFLLVEASDSGGNYLCSVRVGPIFGLD